MIIFYRERDISRTSGGTLRHYEVYYYRSILDYQIKVEVTEKELELYLSGLSRNLSRRYVLGCGNACCHILRIIHECSINISIICIYYSKKDHQLVKADK